MFQSVCDHHHNFISKFLFIYFYHILLFTNMFQSVCDHHHNFISKFLFIYFYHILLFTNMFQSLCNHHQGVIQELKQYKNSCTKCLIKTAWCCSPYSCHILLFTNMFQLLLWPSSSSSWHTRIQTIINQQLYKTSN